MDHIERMEVELKELKEKYEKGCDFLFKEEEEPKFTNKHQRELLTEQLMYMGRYLTILTERISYERELLENKEENIG